jgi:hypothetical protein
MGAGVEEDARAAVRLQTQRGVDYEGSREKAARENLNERHFLGRAEAVP